MDAGRDGKDTLYIYTRFLQLFLIENTDGRENRKKKQVRRTDTAWTKHAYNHPGSIRNTRPKERKGNRRYQTTVSYNGDRGKPKAGRMRQCAYMCIVMTCVVVGGKESERQRVRPCNGHPFCQEE